MLLLKKKECQMVLYKRLACDSFSSFWSVQDAVSCSLFEPLRVGLGVVLRLKFLSLHKSLEEFLDITWSVYQRWMPVAVEISVSERKGAKVLLWVNTQPQAYYNIKQDGWCVLAVCRTKDAFAEKQSPLLLAGTNSRDYSFVHQQLNGSIFTNTENSSIIRQWCTHTHAWQ